MVNDEVVVRRKKKVKKKLSELDGDDDPSPIKKKKKTTNNAGGESVKKKKKKKKKLLKNSTLLLDQSQNAEQMEANSDEELFGSQSPIPGNHGNQSPIPGSQSPISGVPFQSPPPLSKHSPPHDPHNGAEEEDEEGDVREEEEPEVKKSPVKRSPLKKHPVNSAPDRPAPVMVFKKKSAAEAVAAEDSDSDEVGSDDDELHDLPASGEAALALMAPVAPLSHPLISQHEQDQRDLTLLHQVSEKFPESRVQEINWNEVYCFNMSPDAMSARLEVLLSNIPREKSVRTLTNEAKVAFCNAKIREVPMTKRQPFYANSSEGTKKRINAFTLFSSQFDAKQHSKLEIKTKWDATDPEYKKKLMKEARALNNIHRINRGEPKARRPMSGYTMFTKELMNQGLKMVDIGVRWKAMSVEEKEEYKAKADAANRERTPSNHEPATQS